MRLATLCLVGATSLVACKQPDIVWQERVGGELAPSGRGRDRELALVRTLARADLGCADVVVEEHSRGGVVRASGCGEHALYYRDACDFLRPPGVCDPLDSASANGGRVSSVDFVPLAATPGGRSISHDAHVALALNARAARDLKCPSGNPACGAVQRCPV